MWGSAPADQCTGNAFYGCSRTAGAGMFGHTLSTFPKQRIHYVHSFEQRRKYSVCFFPPAVLQLVSFFFLFREQVVTTLTQSNLPASVPRRHSISNMAGLRFEPSCLEVTGSGLPCGWYQPIRIMVNGRPVVKLTSWNPGAMRLDTPPVDVTLWDQPSIGGKKHCLVRYSLWGGG